MACESSLNFRLKRCVGRCGSSLSTRFGRGQRVMAGRRKGLCDVRAEELETIEWVYVRLLL